MSKIHLNRIKKALQLLKASGSNEALVIGSNPAVTRSRDTHYPYRQNSDLFYLTGSLHSRLTLVLRPYARETVILIAPERDPVRDLWEGAEPAISKTASAIGAKVVTSKDQVSTTLSLLRGAAAAHLPSVTGSVGGEVRRQMLGKTATELAGLPPSVHEAEHLTAKLRAFKDAHEVEAIARAADLTSATLNHVSQFIKPGVKEREIAALIEYLYRLHGAEPAFGTIVAAGKSAATLHYRSLERTLKRGELLLIDTGCELDLYACDISRTVAVGMASAEEIDPRLAALHDTVLRAQRAAIAKVRPGVHITDVHKAAARELTHGLKDLGVLRGSITQLINKQAYKPYFPHGIGHSLGIDVHDVSPEINGRLGVLEAGMVITIEPGLYFNKPIAKIPACGIRIEDDVLVTPRGRAILTEDVFPREL
jgi:Xaa-Pro aminopeptidase